MTAAFSFELFILLYFFLSSSFSSVADCYEDIFSKYRACQEDVSKSTYRISFNDLSKFNIKNLFDKNVSVVIASDSIIFLIIPVGGIGLI